VSEEDCKIVSNFIFEDEVDLSKIEKEDLNGLLPPEVLLERFICKPDAVYITSPRKRLDYEKLLEIHKKKQTVYKIMTSKRLMAFFEKTGWEKLKSKQNSKK